MQINNSGYLSALKLISKLTHHDEYLFLGSVATLAYTEKIGYTRQIHDIDLIMDSKLALKATKLLLDNGFTQNTFINKRMPFYNYLIKHAQSNYLRFTKNGVAVEILSTQFLRTDNNLRFDLYPNVWVQIPMKSVENQSLSGVSFKTLNVNLLWSINTVLHKTLGRIMKYKKEQREMDLHTLKALVDINHAKLLLSECRLGYLKLEFKVPNFLIS
jgi:hypothetical protein